MNRPMLLLLYMQDGQTKSRAKPSLWSVDGSFLTYSYSKFADIDLPQIDQEQVNKIMDLIKSGKKESAKLGDRNILACVILQILLLFSGVLQKNNEL